jgi:glycosyltransferase involved in cell wall biosynthesis
MRLFMTADAVGGVWTYALELCSALAAHDVNVLLATMGPRPAVSQRKAASALANVELIESEFALEWMPDPWQEVDAAGEWLLEKARHFNPDIVHLNGYAHVSLPWSRPVVSVAHSCVSTWWQAVHGCEPPEEWNEYRRRVRHGLTHADRVVAPTHAFASNISSAYQLARSIDVIHNGRAPRPVKDGGTRSKIVLACGRAWDAAKNFSTLDAAIADLPWPAYLAGGTQSPDGHTWAPRNLECLGALPESELSEWRARAEIFVHPALYEPFGLALLEAAMSGCCLALSDLSSMRELWDGAAEFFDPRSTESVRAAIRRLIASPHHRATLRAAARERAEQLSSASMAAHYMHLYREISNSRRAVHQAVA